MDRKVPRYCYVEGLGRCRVLEYVGKGYFRVLRKQTDSIYRIHRDRIAFQKGS